VEENERILMGFVLDAILKKILFEDQVINSSFISDPIQVSGVDQSYLVQFDYFNGDGSIVASVALEASIDGINYVPYTNGTIDITEDDGNFIWDVANSGANFIRINCTVSAGEFTATCRFSGKRRH
jgi:hypothetical protein